MVNPTADAGAIATGERDCSGAMMPTFEERLAELDRLIERFSELVKDYPNNPPYADSLTNLRKKRAELASTIGK